MHWQAKLKVFCIKLSKRTNDSRAKKFFDVLQQLKFPGRALLFIILIMLIQLYCLLKVNKS